MRRLLLFSVLACGILSTRTLHAQIPSYLGAGGSGATNCAGLSDAGPLCNLALPTDALLYGPNGALSSPTTNGRCIVQFNVTASAAVAPSCALPGVSVNAQSGNYSLAYSDRAAYLKFSGGTTAVLTLCQIATTCASNFTFVVQNLNSGNLTITPNAADCIDQTTCSGGALGASITIGPNIAVFVYQDSSSAPGNWWTIRLKNSSGPVPLMSSGNHGTVAGSTTDYQLINGGGSAPNATENNRVVGLGRAGIVQNMCITTTTAQPAGGTLVATFRDATAASNSAVTVSFAASAPASTLCDTTHTATITANHEYDIQMVNSSSSTSAAIGAVTIDYYPNY